MADEDLLAPLTLPHTHKNEDSAQQGDDEDGGQSTYDRVQTLKESLARMSSTLSAKSTPKRWFSAASRSPDRRAPWRKKLGEVLESFAFHIFIVCLLLVDLLATAVDILKTIHNDNMDLRTCTRLLEACYCISSFERSEPWEFLHWISVGILGVLLLNILGLLVAFGGSFFMHPGYVLDAVVVGTAMYFEIFLKADTAGLLIILNLWRIVRVAHGIFEVTDEAWKEEIQKFEGRIHGVEQVCARDQEALKRKDMEIEELKQQLSLRYGEVE